MKKKKISHKAKEISSVQKRRRKNHTNNEQRKEPSKTLASYNLTHLLYDRVVLKKDDDDEEEENELYE